MARLTAAASGLAFAILLMCLVLVAGQELDSLFPKVSLPPPVRIYCRQDAALNMAVRDGNVVLAHANCSDLSQKWYFLTTSPSAAAEPGPLPFSLLNAKTAQVITIPSNNAQQVGLVEVSSQPDAIIKELWTAEKPTRDDGFYQLFVTKDKTFTLNGLLGNVHNGTLVGIYSASPNSENALWQITSYPLCYR